MEYCEACKNMYDPEVCWCGDYIDHHYIGSGHMGVPMGCTCGYDKTEEEKNTLIEVL